MLLVEVGGSVQDRAEALCENVIVLRTDGGGVPCNMYAVLDKLPTTFDWDIIFLR